MKLSGISRDSGGWFRSVAMVEGNMWQWRQRWWRTGGYWVEYTKTIDNENTSTKKLIACLKGIKNQLKLNCQLKINSPRRRSYPSQFGLKLN